MDEKKRTQISTDSLPAIQEPPPTTIVGDKMVVDPIKLIKTWVDSADVLRSVAKVAREGQEDNLETRRDMRTHRKVLIIAGIMISLIQLGSVVGVYLVTSEAKDECTEALRACKENGPEAKLLSR